MTGGWEGDRSVDDEKAPRRFNVRSVLASLPVWALTALVLAAIAVPIFLNQRVQTQDADAKNLLLEAVPSMKDCAERAGGSYTSCDAATLEEIDPGIAWRDSDTEDIPVARKERVGRVYVSELGDATYQLETTSPTKTFSYKYEGGVVTRTASSGAEGPVSW